MYNRAKEKTERTKAGAEHFEWDKRKLMFCCLNREILSNGKKKMWKTLQWCIRYFVRRILSFAKLFMDVCFWIRKREKNSKILNSLTHLAKKAVEFRHSKYTLLSKHDTTLGEFVSDNSFACVELFKFKSKCSSKMSKASECVIKMAELNAVAEFRGAKKRIFRFYRNISWCQSFKMRAFEVFVIRTKNNERNTTSSRQCHKVKVLPRSVCFQMDSTQNECMEIFKRI